jgi:hypothetical protein
MEVIFAQLIFAGETTVKSIFLYRIRQYKVYPFKTYSAMTPSAQSGSNAFRQVTGMAFLNALLQAIIASSSPSKGQSHYAAWDSWSRMR